MRLLGNREDAAEVVQETFLRAFWKISGFRQQAAFCTWLYRIMLNLCYRRLAQRRREVPMPEDSQAQQPEPVDPAPSPRQQVQEAETAHLVREALSRLPFDEFQILTLREINGFSYEELSRALNIPQGTVMSRLHRARLSLVRHLSQMGIGA